MPLPVLPEVEGAPDEGGGGVTTLFERRPARDDAGAGDADGVGLSLVLTDVAFNRAANEDCGMVFRLAGSCYESNTIAISRSRARKVEGSKGVE